jgi:multidrug efflux pump subunit AcrA (membrane-fusion protein)
MAGGRRVAIRGAIGIMNRFVRWTLIVTVVAAALAGFITRAQWWSFVSGLLRSPDAGAAEHDDHAHDDHAEHDVVLSKQARRNLGLQVGPVAAADRWRTVTVPGSLIERPGHSHRKAAAPMTGVVRELFIHPNQLVHPGDLLAVVDLTGDALAEAQSGLLATVRNLEINARELDRITPLVDKGAVPGKQKLELEYERQRLQSEHETRVQALQVLGMTTEQITQLAETRTLLRELVVRVPQFSSEERMHAREADVRPAALFGNPATDNGQRTADQPSSLIPHPSSPTPGIDWSYTVESIDVYPGKRVEVGDELCSLAFHVTLFIEGQAFEKEGELIARAMIERWPVQAVFESGGTGPLIRHDLAILNLDNTVDPQSRTFRFFVPLANEVLHDTTGPEGETYRSWRFKPGQKVTLRVPTGRLTGVISVPVEAVAREGPDAFVFRVSGNKFERQPVHVLHVEGGDAVLAHDGSLFPGETVALNHAYQLNLALKRQTGTGGHGHSHDH